VYVQVLGRWDNSAGDDATLAELLSEDRETRISGFKHKGVRGKYDQKIHSDFNNSDFSTLTDIKFDNIFFKVRTCLGGDHKQVQMHPEYGPYLFRQVKRNVLTNKWPITEEEVDNYIPPLIAVFLQEQLGDFVRGPTGHTDAKIIQALDRLWLPKSRTAIQVNLDENYIFMIKSKWKTLAGLSPADCQYSALEYAAQFQFYEAQEFTIVQNQSFNWPGTLILSVTHKMVHLSDPKAKRVPLQSWDYWQIITWGASDQKMILVVGSLHQSRKMTFLTAQGDVIINLIDDYVNFNLRKNATGEDGSSTINEIIQNTKAGD
jgi:hypothetical protein